MKMTLGKKLSNHRKIAGITQQQLAEQLNMSAQAISKWENDMSEPDLTTLKTLARLYNTTVDELLDVDGEAPTATPPIDVEEVVNSAFSKIEEHIKTESQTVGFCKSCGTTVTEENLGDTEPVIICKKCKEKQIAEEKAKAEKIKQLEKQKIEEEKNKHRWEMNSMRHHRKKSLIWSAVASIPFLIFMLIKMFGGAWSDVGFLFLGAYAAFAFTFTMFYDSFVKDLFFDMLGATVHWPGLIFTFDLDGIIWLIGMKILFAVLGFLIGLIAAILGVFITALLSLFAFPIILIIYSIKIRAGIYEDPELE